MRSPAQYRLFSELPTFRWTITLQQCKLIGHPRVETEVGSHEVA